VWLITLPLLGSNGNSVINNLPFLGSITNNLPIVGATVNAAVDIGTALSVPLGIALDLEVSTQLLCSLVSATFSNRQYDMGCTCLGSDGRILLDVDVDVSAIVNVAGLDAWMHAQVCLASSGDGSRADEV